MNGPDRTVLIVEDEDDLRELLLEVFRDEGYRVASASNGREALEAIRQLPRPCVVVLDLILPQINGADVYAAMQADPTLADVPVIVSTSDPRRAPAGARVMKKPVPIDALLAVVGAMF